MKELIELIKDRAKELTIAISELEEDMSAKQQVHRDALDLLLEIHKLETIYMQTISGDVKPPIITKDSQPPKELDEDAERHEINKIHRRLPMWANKQYQINSKILSLFLKMEDEGFSEITEKMLMKRYNNQPEFLTNFPQMKTISPKNHGKVFDVQNSVVKIWEPVRHDVEEYKNIIFKK